MTFGGPREPEIDALPLHIHLIAEGLLSKWGFGDGDVLDDLSYALWADEGLRIGQQELLVAAVRKWLLPALDQRVEVVEVITIHNPIRATTIDGEHVEHLWYEVDDGAVLLTPASVQVATSDLLDLARSLPPKVDAMADAMADPKAPTDD